MPTETVKSPENGLGLLAEYAEKTRDDVKKKRKPEEGNIHFEMTIDRLLIWLIMHKICLKVKTMSLVIILMIWKQNKGKLAVKLVK